jgi:MtrB/PioB family decaheme-associated outer membrane protein
MRRTLWLLIALVPVYGGATDYTPNYDNVDNNRWRCRLCPFDEAAPVSVNASSGVNIVSDDAARFGRDNGLNEEGTSAELGVGISAATETGGFASIQAVDLGVDARRVLINAGRHGLYDWTLSWREIPRNNWAEAITPYQGRTVLKLPVDWVSGFTTADMATSNNRTADFGTLRKYLSAGVKANPDDRWQVSAEVSRRKKTGSEITGSDFFNQAALMSRPIDYTTDEYAGSVSYGVSAFHASLSYRASEFSNDDSSLTWENPYPVFSGLSHGRKALAPDNEASQWQARMRFRAFNSVLRASHSRGETTQNDAFLPYTINQAVVVEDLPAASLNGKVETSQTSLSLSSRVSSMVTVNFRYRNRERDNKTPVLLLTPVTGDLFATAPTESRAYSFERSKKSVDISLRPYAGLRLTTGLQQDDMARSRSEVAQNEETRRYILLSARPGNRVHLRLRFEDGYRDADEFQAITNNNPLTRRYHMAERDQVLWRGDLDYQLPDDRWLVSLHGERRFSEFPESELGVQHDEDRAWGVDMSYQGNDGVHFSAGRRRESVDSVNYGSSVFASRDWVYETSDRVTTTALLIEKSGLLGNRLDISMSYLLSDGVGRYDTVVQDQLSRFPRLVSDHRSIDLNAIYKMSDMTSLKLRHYREDYTAADWALDNVRQDTVRNVLGLGLESANHDVSMTSVSVIWNWAGAN